MKTQTSFIELNKQTNLVLKAFARKIGPGHLRPGRMITRDSVQAGLSALVPVSVMKRSFSVLSGSHSWGLQLCLGCF